jgi:hypothetical protein
VGVRGQALRVLEGNHLLDPTDIKSGWETMTPEEARGFVWLFEPPVPRARYVVSCDPAEGVTGWDRSIMNEDDQGYDNSVVQVWRVGQREVEVEDADGKRTVQRRTAYYQCAEYAAPVDYVETARVINALGRLYAGSDPRGAAHCIIEVYPGPGGIVLRELVQRYGYVNLYQPRFSQNNAIMPDQTRQMGFNSNVKTVRDLWILGKRSLDTGVAVVRSPWLLEEMRTTEPIKFMQYTSEAQSGFHDDRLRAAMLAFRAIEDTYKPIRPQMTATVEHGRKRANWQTSDISAEDMEQAWEDRFDEIFK